jgi:exopolysaccharide biosynthesis polyprenyl glycosylphosphotransferase
MVTNKYPLIEYSPLVATIDLLVLNSCSWFVLSLNASRLPAVDLNYGIFWWHLSSAHSICALIILFGCGLYRDWARRPLADLAIFLSVAIALLAVAWVLLCRWEQQCEVPWYVIAQIVQAQTLALIIARTTIRSIVHGAPTAQTAVIVASDRASAERVKEKLLASSPAWFSIGACLTVKEFDALPDNEIDWDTVFLTSEIEQKGSIVRRGSRLRKNILLVPGTIELFMLGARLLNVDDVLVASLTPPGLNLGQRIEKRAMDIAGSLILLVISAPVMAAVALLIRLTSPGKAIFSQKRVGRDGIEFHLYKFRTMISDAERHTGPVLATADDPRITKVGAFLRATRLDEFPQLFNVLRGEMSLVGPRPERGHFIREFRERIPGYEFRLSVKPGVTGPAQVCGSYSTTAERKLRFDLMYVNDYSLFKDINILLRTFAVLIRVGQARGVEKGANLQQEPISEARKPAG